MQEDIFISVIEAHKGLLYKIANAYCKTTEDRKDLIQEIIFQLWRSFEKYDPAYRYSTWMYRIALNTAISFYRKNKRSPFALEIKEDILDICEPRPDDSNDQLKRLNTFILELKDLDKALMLLYLEEKSYKEIAEVMGISETNVGTRISRIKQFLKQKFNINHG